MYKPSSPLVSSVHFQAVDNGDVILVIYEVKFPIFNGFNIETVDFYADLT